MNGIQTWGGAVTMSMIDLWDKFFSFLPALIGAFLVFILGWIIASAFEKIVEKGVKAVKIDAALEKMGVSSKIADVGIKMNVAGFLGGLIKWFLVLVFLMAATDILGLSEVTDFLNSIILYLPNVVVAVVIMAIALLVANFTYNVVKGSTRAAGVMSATLLATISKWAIVIFGLMAALLQLRIAVSLVNNIFIGIVAALSLAIGLSFGLGGKDEAAMIIRKIREEITERK